MPHNSLTAGQAFPDLHLPLLGVKSDAALTDVSKPKAPYDWKLILVYRGAHCPLCTRYLSELNDALPEINALGVDVVAISADPEGKAASQIEKITPDYDVAYGLTIAQMQGLGLYISNPRSAEKTDRPFAEPGLFIVNGEGKVQIVDTSNAPFVRPEIKTLIMGLGFIRNPENNYPIRGTYHAD